MKIFVTIWNKIKSIFKDKEYNPLDEQCPICGYYCHGHGGFGCIDKPTIIENYYKNKKEE